MKKGLILLASCAALISCGQSGQSGAKAPECAVMTVNATTSNLTNSYPATIKGKQDVDIRPMVSGFITKLHVDEGASVRKGQVLFTIDQVQYQAAVDQAKASVATAEAAVNTQQLTYDNRKMLNAKEITSDFDLQTQENVLAQAKANLAQARAALISAQRNLEYTNVTSPSDGVVGTIPYRLGSLVSPSSAQALTTVSDISNMYAYFSMTERDLLNLTKEYGSGDIIKNLPEIQLQLIDGSLYPLKGRVETISGSIDVATGSVTLRALFPNPDRMLLSGGTANVVFPNDLANVFIVPQSATTEIQDKKFVFVLQGDNTVTSTEIQVSPVDDGKNYIVLGGLKEGDKIVTENIQKLRTGDVITPITAAQKEAIYQQNLQDQKDGNIQSAMQ